MSSPTETVIETRSVAVDSRTVQIIQLVWPDGGVLYDVYYGDDCLTDDESLDHIPDENEIRELFAAAEAAEPLTGMEEWVRALVKEKDLCFARVGTMFNGQPVWACMDDCACVFVVDDTDFLDRFSLATDEGPSCPSRQDCACHVLPRRRPGSEDD